MTSVLAPVVFDAPLVNPSAAGLFSVTQWTDAGEGEALRWLPSGVEVRPINYGVEDSFGVWAADWCAREADLGPGDVKRAGDRPAPLDSFLPVTVWSSDECDLTAQSRVEVRTRAAQVMRLREQVAVEEEFSARMLVDAGTPTAAAGVVAAVARIEGLLAKTNTVGFVHASPEWAAFASEADLIVRSGAGLKTPLGHTWVFGGGYVDALGSTLVATR